MSPASTDCLRPEAAGIPGAWLKLECFLVRCGERLLPLPLFRAVLWPMLAVRAARAAWPFRQHEWASSKLPGDLRRPGTGLSVAWRSFLARNYAAIPSMFPDRLMSPRWRKRIRYVGMEHLLGAWERATPIILATVHFNSLSMLRCLLTLRGISVAATAFGSDRMIAAGTLKDLYLARVVGPTRTEPVHRVGDVRKLKSALTSGTALIICVDAGVGNQVTGSSGSASLRMASGAIRLARSTGAELFPTIIYEERPWHYVVQIGQPVDVHHEVPDKTAADALTRKFLPVISRHLEQYECGPLSFWSPAHDHEAG